MRKFAEIEDSGLAYVYEHWRPDTGTCFWVGKGTTIRYRIYKRNRHYNSIAAKLRAAGLKIEVRFVATHLSDEQAYSIEMKRIEFWKAQDVKLANKAIGGRGGMSGVSRSPESRAKQSATMRGRKLAPDHVQQICDRVRSPEGRAFTRALHTGRKRPPETGERISIGVKKSWEDPDVRANHLAGIENRPPTSEEARAKMRAAQTPERRAALAEIVSAKWDEPGERERRSAAMSVANRKRPVTEKQREAGRATMTPEHNAVMRVAFEEKMKDPAARAEWCANLSAARTGKKYSESHVESLKKSWTPERRQRVSEKLKAFNAARRAEKETRCSVV